MTQQNETTDAKPRLSVLVPCRNEREQIERVVRSILAQETPAGGMEVIVADGMSDDGTRSVLSRLTQSDARLKVVDNPRRIVSTGLNQALRIARGEIILRMDAHTTYAPDYIISCVRVLNETKADNVGGPWIANGDGLVGRAIAAAFQSPFAVGGARSHQDTYTGPVDTVYLGCWPREVFDRIGLFDEELVRNQDDELNLRLVKAGGKIWQSPRIRSWYAPRGSLRDLFRQYVQYGYWKVRVIRKHKVPASWRHLVPATFLLSLALSAVLTPWLAVARWSLFALIAGYVICNLVASVMTAARQGWKFLPLLPVVFASYHFGYGYGFVRGLLDFVLLRREPNRAYSRSTRSSLAAAFPNASGDSQSDTPRP